MRYGIGKNWPQPRIHPRIWNQYFLPNIHTTIPLSWLNSSEHPFHQYLLLRTHDPSEPQSSFFALPNLTLVAAYPLVNDAEEFVATPSLCRHRPKHAAFRTLPAGVQGISFNGEHITFLQTRHSSLAETVNVLPLCIFHSARQSLWPVSAVRLTFGSYVGCW